MQIDSTDAAVTWFKNELELPENNKVLVFFVRYGGDSSSSKDLVLLLQLNQRKMLILAMNNNMTI